MVEDEIPSHVGTERAKAREIRAIGVNREREGEPGNGKRQGGKVKIRDRQ
jgi:hypothetical protein